MERESNDIPKICSVGGSQGGTRLGGIRQGGTQT
jgi:hypothetical protein